MGTKKPKKEPTGLPPEARRGVERAFLAILRERHPGVMWVIVPPEKRDG